MAAGARVAPPRIALPLVGQAAVRSAPRAGMTEAQARVFPVPSPACAGMAAPSGQPHGASTLTRASRRLRRADAPKGGKVWRQQPPSPFPLPPRGGGDKNEYRARG